VGGSGAGLARARGSRGARPPLPDRVARAARVLGNGGAWRRVGPRGQRRRDPCGFALGGSSSPAPGTAVAHGDGPVGARYGSGAGRAGRLGSARPPRPRAGRPPGFSSCSPEGVGGARDRVVARSLVGGAPQARSRTVGKRQDLAAGVSALSKATALVGAVAPDFGRHTGPDSERRREVPGARGGSGSGFGGRQSEVRPAFPRPL
jgi:hypothetical protein